MTEPAQFAREDGETAQSTPVTVVVADDHPLFRKALQETIDAQDGLEVVGVAADGEHALELIRTHEPQVAVLDVRMPRLDGREVVRRVRQDELDTRVLFVSEYHGGELVLQALTAGGAGYLSKAATAEEICSAIVRIARGEAVLPSDVGTDLATTLRERGDGGTRLTARELSVLELIAEGESAGVIARRLHLAVPTVKTHIQNLYAKLGVNDRGAAVAEAMRRGLLT
ncbi:MAG TPA: response regulator transcription factor [Solirubrobacteraceae bacterium]|nr:response regulator transcription factor [Solirubrobacteraceae bacterium]